MRILAIAVFGLLVAACGGGGSSTPGAADRPASVLATFTRAGDFGDRAALFARQIKPGDPLPIRDTELTAAGRAAIGFDGTSGLDRASPLTVIAADLGDGTGLQLALVARMADPNKVQDEHGTATVVTRGEIAVIGPKPVVDAVSAWAFDHVVTAPAPATGFRAVIYVPDLLRVHGAHFDRFRAAFAKEVSGGDAALERVLALAGDAVRRGGNDIAELDVTLDVKEELTVDLAAVPKPDSDLAKFVAAQTPSEFPLLLRLPAPGAVPPPIVAGGKVQPGPYAFAPGITALLGYAAGTDAGKLVDGLAGATTSEVALVWRPESAGGAGLALAGLTDAKAAATALTVLPAREAYGPTAVRGTESFAIAALDDLAVLVSGVNTAARLGTSIEIARAHQAPPATLSKYIERARSEHDFALVVLDIPHFTVIQIQGPKATQFPVGIGVDGGALHLRVTLTPAAARSLYFE